MDRRHFLYTTGLSIASAILSRNSFAGESSGKALINFPDSVSAIINGRDVKLKSSDQQSWIYQDLVLALSKYGENAILAEVQAPAK